MRNILRYIIFILLFIPLTVFGQYFKNQNTSDGLPNNTVKCFAQDQYGFIWMGTFNGLARYDGYEFISYRHYDNDDKTIIDSHVESLLADKDGLYVGTGKGLDYLSFKDYVFHRCKYIVAKGKEKPLSRCISQILKCEQSIYALDISGKLWCSKQGIDSFELFKLNKASLYKAIAYYRQGMVLILTDKNLSLVNIRRHKVLSSIAVNNLPSSWNVLYYSKNQDAVFLGSGIGYGGKAFRIDAHNTIHHSDEFTPSDIKAIIDFGKETFFGTDGEGLKSQSSVFTPQNCNISSYAIHSLFVDNNGNLWAGTYRDGCNIMSPRLNAFQSLTMEKGQLSYSVVTAIYVLNGIIYTGMDGGGLNVYDTKSGKKKIYTIANSTIPGNNVLSMVGDGRYLWTGIYGKGLCRYSIRDGNFKTYKMPMVDNQLKLNVIWQIIDDGKGHLLVKGDKLYIFDKEKETFQYVKSLANKAMSCMFLDGDVLWAATNRGLYKIDTGDYHIIKHYSNQLLDNVTCLYVDKDHKIWFGIKYDGLRILDQNTCKIKKIGVEEGLGGMDIASINHDENGNLWIGTDNGLFFYHYKYKLFVRYGKDDYLMLTQFCNNSFFRDGSMMYYGTTRGLVYFDENHIKNERYNRTVYFNSIGILKDHQSINLFSDHPDKVSMNHDQNFFTISFSTPEMISPTKIKFKYKLDGFDKQWRIKEGSREISYTNVPSGTYTFLIIPSNSDGEWSNHTSMLEMKIAQPWWNTIWADLLWLLLITGVAYSILKFHAYKQKVKNELLQKEREKEIEKKTNEEKLNFFANIAHELRTPMFLITAPLEELLSLPQRPVQVPHSYLKGMFRNAIRLNKLIDRILDFRKLESGNLKLRLQHHEIVKFCRRLSVDYIALCQQKKITFKFSSSDEVIYADFDSEKLELIISNLVSNAYKYTNEGGTILLNIENRNNDLEFTVSDSGIGIEERELDKIFNKYYRVDEETKTVGDGLGLSMVKSLVEVHGGTIHVLSKPANGSKFIFTIPKSQPHEVGQKLPPAEIIDDIDEIEDNSEEVPEEKINLQSPVAARSLLIIDDEQETIEILTRYLVADYKILTAGDGVSGLEIAGRELPDLIICDIMMPQMDGYEFLEHIKKDKKLEHIPIIMLSAKILDDDKIAAFKYGADAYLTKPISLKYLKSRVEALLSKNNSTLNTASLFTNGTTQESHYSKEDQLFILKCKEIIDQNLMNENLSVDFLANQLNMSHSSLDKKIKTITGNSPVNLILEYRIFRAVQMFKEGETNITKVSQMCGFNDVRSFRSAFKNRMNLSPKQFVQQI